MKPYYSENGIVIYHGKAEEVLPSLPSSSAGLFITSPPYNLREGMERKGGLRVGHKSSKWRHAKLYNGYQNHGDNLPYDEYVSQQKNILSECWRILDDAGAIFYNHKPRVVNGSLRLPTVFIPEGVNLRQVIIWDRCGGINSMYGAYMPIHEWILLLCKSKFYLRDLSASSMGDLWRFPPDTNSDHPCAFPLALPCRILQTVTSPTVIDPYMGSGTVLRAAKDFHRSAIGIEVSEAYCEIAAKRLAQNVFNFAEAI